MSFKESWQVLCISILDYISYFFLRLKIKNKTRVSRKFFFPQKSVDHTPRILLRKCGAAGGLLTVLSLIWENITEIKVSNPARTQVKTACLLLGQHSGLLAKLCYGLQSKWSYLIYHMTKGLDSVRGVFCPPILISNFGFKTL